MKRIISTILCLLLLLPTMAHSLESKEEGEFFVKLMCDKERVILGDSCLLTVVLYASHPFQLKERQEPLRVKHAKVRRLNIGRQSLQRVAENNRPYYAWVSEQYVLTPQELGKMCVQERQFKIDLHIQQGTVDPFDAFFGRRPPVKVVEKKAKQQVFRIEVVEKPRRTMMEMKRSGVEVI